jgi:DNA-binding transcriptional MerR regulator
MVPTVALELDFKSSGAMDDDDLDIAEVARRTGLAPSALRFYERKGLIEPTGRVGLRRQYSRSVIDRLAIVIAATEAGFLLDEVREVFDAERPDHEVRARLGQKIVEIDRRIDLLSDIRERIRHATTCAAPNLLECPDFLEGARRTLPPAHTTHP